MKVLDSYDGCGVAEAAGAARQFAGRKISKGERIMPVLDFSNASTEKTEDSVCTYTTFASDENTTSPEQPILVLANSVRQWKHHSCGRIYQSGETDGL